MLRQEYLKEVLNYNPETGIFVWKQSLGRRIHIGDIAGSLNKGYVRIKINKKHYKAHRLAWLYMTGSWPEFEVDHINHIRHDNRFENLRDITHQENQFNRSEQKNTSGYVGVYWEKQRNEWRARISVNGKKIHLGFFTDKEEAAKAYHDAKEKYHFI